MYDANAEPTDNPEDVGGEAASDATDPRAPFKPSDLQANIAKVNLCDDIDPHELNRIGADVVEGYEIDQASRDTEGWTVLFNDALKLAKQVKEEKTTPWPNASNVKYPLVTTAAIQFAARAYPALIDGFNVVKGKVLGKPDDQKRARADAVGAHMSWQLMEQMPEWEPETDQLLHMLPVVGSVFRKVWFDPIKGRNVSQIRLPDKVVVNYWAKTDPPRTTDVIDFYPNECQTKFLSGIWRKIELGVAPGESNDKQAPHEFLEQHCLLDLDGDGYQEPYTVTVHKESAQVVRIVTRYYADGIKQNQEGQVVEIEPCQHFIKYDFMPSFDGSYLGMGFGILLASINGTVNTLVNQLLDAGKLSNLQAGFIDKGIKMAGGRKTFEPGEWKRVEYEAGKKLSESIVPLPVREPSAVLFNLLNLMIEASKDITATKDILTGEAQGSNQAVGTTLALIEQGLKVYTSIVKRVHRALGEELKVYYKLNSLYLDEEQYFQFQDDEKSVAKTDYNQGDLNVVPVSDPNMATDMQKVARAQYLLSFRGQGLDDAEINRRALEAGGITDIAGLQPKGPPPPNPDFVIKGHELEIKDRAQKLAEREFERSEMESLADIALKDAQAKQITVETIMADPALYATINQIVMDSVNALRAQSEAMEAPGPTDNAAENQPGTDGGMAGPPDNQAGIQLPIGPQGAAGQEVDGGQPPVAGNPMGSEGFGGADQSQ